MLRGRGGEGDRGRRGDGETWRRGDGERGGKEIESERDRKGVG